MARPQNLPALIRSKFASAQEAGDLTFFPTQVSILQCAGQSFQLRYSPALANKPKANKKPISKPVDVFENPRKLLVTQWPPAHNIVLNKFAINAHHFILATKDFKEQTHLLEEDDLGAAYACVQAYREQGQGLFAFFNSGEHSGASQPHRHIQFLPIESMQQGISEDQKWQLLTDQLVQDPKPVLPFSYFAANLPSSPSPGQIHETYSRLYNLAVHEVHKLATGSTANNHVDEATISYNLAMTDRVLVICPRLAEGTAIADTHGSEIGSVALNGTVLGGTLLVKDDLEWKALRNDATKLHIVLQKIGVPSKGFEDSEQKL